MLPEITYRQIRNVEFPVFALPKGELYFKDGLLTINDAVIDDKNMSGKSLGMRRLQTEHKLKRLNRSIADLESLIASGYNTFIDSSGRIFKYNKTKYLKVKYHKINNIELCENFSKLYVYGIDNAFILQRPPQDGEEWAGILYIDDKYPWSLYKLSTNKLPEHKKKV